MLFNLTGLCKIMDKDVFDNLSFIQRQRLSIEEQNPLENTIYDMDAFHSMVDIILNKENNNIQNRSNNPGPPTEEIPSEICHGTDCVSERPEVPHTFVECVSAKVLNNPGPSTMETQSEISHNADKVSEQLETLNSLVECINSAEIFDNSKPSTLKIQSKMSVSTDNISEQSGTSNFPECINAEVVGNSGSSIMKVQSEMCHTADNPESFTMEIQSEIRNTDGPESFMEIQSVHYSKCHNADKMYKEMPISMDISTDLPLSPKPSTSTEDLSEMQHNADKVFKQPKALNFSRKHPSAEIIDVSSDSDTDSDDSYKNFENSSGNSFENSFENSDDDIYNDISIINTVNKTIDISSCSTSQLTHNNDNTSLANKINILSTGNDRQATDVNNKVQNRPKEEVVEENNNDVLYIKKKRLNSPKPGCSKDSEDTFLEMEDFYMSNMDELLKDAKLIHALLPRYSYRLIYKMLSSNKFARNRIELTLWDLLPKERPLPQYLKRQKCSDETSFIERKKNSHISLQENHVDTNTSEKKEQTCAKNEVIASNRKSKNITFASSTTENDETKKNVSEVTASNNTNDTNQTMIPLKKKKLEHKSDGSTTSVKDASSTSNINMIVPHSKIFASPEVGSETKESHSTKNSEVRCTYESDRHLELYKIHTVVAPAKLMLRSNFTTQKDEKFHKPTTPVLSPPKLKVLTKSTISTMSPIGVSIPICSVPIIPNRLKRTGPNIMQVKQDKPIILRPNLNESTIVRPNSKSSISQYPIGRFTTCSNLIKQNEPTVRVSHLNSSLFAPNSTLPGTSSNDKRASDMRAVPLPHSMCQSINRIKIEPYVSKITEKDGTKVVNVHTTKTLVVSATLNSSSTSAVPAQSTSHLQKANDSNMTTSQIYDKGSIQVKTCVLL